MSRGRKVFIGLIILSPFMLYLLTSSLNSWWVKPFSVDGLASRESQGGVFEQRILLTGQVDGKSVRVDKTKHTIRFNLVSEQGKNIIPVLIKSKERFLLEDRRVISVKGRYTVEKLFIAEKLID